jgi:hypothetical protein
MIPKIIHYCWLSNDPYPEKIKNCMASWKKYLPDYELMLWNFDRFDINSSLWVKQAFEAKKYAFAADYIRLYALYNYGGIYLDTDVEVLKSFDDLLDLPYFAGKEFSDEDTRPEAAIVGAEKGCFWIEKCLEHYKNRKFITGIGKFDAAVMPAVLEKIIRENYTLLAIPDKASFRNDTKTVCLLPVEYFSPKNFFTLEIKVTPNTYSIHHFASAWGKNKTFAEKIRTQVIDFCVKIGIYKLYRMIIKKK